MPSGNPASCGARAAASWRAAMKPDAQAGAPGQAAIRRRGSAASTMKPSSAAAAARPGARAGGTPISISTRSGAGRIDAHTVARRRGGRARRAHRPRHVRTAARCRARARHRAADAVRPSAPAVCVPELAPARCRIARAARRRRGCATNRPQRACGPSAAISRRIASTTSTARSGAMAPSHAVLPPALQREGAPSPRVQGRGRLAAVGVARRRQPERRAALRLIANPPPRPSPCHAGRGRQGPMRLQCNEPSHFLHRADGAQP